MTDLCCEHRRDLVLKRGDGELGHAEVLSMTCPFVVAGRVAGVASRTGAPDRGRILADAGLAGSGVGLRPAAI